MLSFESYEEEETLYNTAALFYLLGYVYQSFMRQVFSYMRTSI